MLNVNIASIFARTVRCAPGRSARDDGRRLRGHAVSTLRRSF
jgi:hypothetical protein